MYFLNLYFPNYVCVLFCFFGLFVVCLFVWVFFVFFVCLFFVLFVFLNIALQFPIFPCYFHLCRKYIEVTIIDDEEYEKDVNFFIQLGEPRLIRRGEGM